MLIKTQSTNRKSKARSVSEDDFVGASYGDDLASALSRAVAIETPIFTQASVERSSGILGRRPTAVKRVVSPVPEKDASSTQPELSNSTTQPPPALISPGPLFLMNAPRPLPRVKQPAPGAPQDPSKQTTFRLGKPPNTPANADMEASRPPKRKGPPGIPHDQLNIRASRLREERSPRKKARVAQRPDAAVIMIDDELVPIVPSRCRSPAPASRAGPDSSSRPPPPPPPLPPPTPSPHARTQHANVAGPLCAGNSGQSASPVEHRAGSHPPVPDPILVLNPTPVTVSASASASASAFTPAPAPAPASSTPPAIPKPASVPTASLASSSASMLATGSTEADLPPVSAALFGIARNVAQLPATLNKYSLPELDAIPARAPPLQPMESNNFMAMAGMLDMTARAMTTAGTLEGMYTQVVQKYEDIHRRLDVLEAREPLVRQYERPVDRIDQFFARMQQVGEDVVRLREEVEKESTERAEETRLLREEVQMAHAEGREQVARLRGEFDKDLKEWHRMAAIIRNLEEEFQIFKASHVDCVKKEEVTALVKGELSGLMLTLRNSTEDMVVKAMEKQESLRTTPSHPIEQRLQLEAPRQVRIQTSHYRRGSFLIQAHQPHPGQPPWHGPNGMHGQHWRGGVHGQLPQMPNGHFDHQRRNYQRGGGPSNFGGHRNYPTYRPQTERNQDPYNNWRSNDRRDRPETGRFVRGPYPGEDTNHDGHQHEDSVRDQPRRGSPRGRSVDARSERSSGGSRRDTN